MNDYILSGRLADVWQKCIRSVDIHISEGKIKRITDRSEVAGPLLMPGFIDAHVHIESSMLLPAAFAAAAVVHGTVATVSDPHEIANVMGIEGIDYLIANSKKVPFKLFFGAPSCVPATPFESAGATLNAADIEQLMQRPDIWYLSEMMNYPGVLHRDSEVMAKIAAAQHAGKPVDGHTPGLKGADAMLYASAGISTDHECFTLEEARDKIDCGMKILIREGSAAKNFEALCALIESHPDKVMLCSDDKHPDDLLQGHINSLVKRALAKGYSFFNVLQAACVNPVLHYNIPVGLLREGDPADFIVVDDEKQLNILQTYCNGIKVADAGKALFTLSTEHTINHFNALPIHASDLQLKATKDKPEIRVIEALEGQLITHEIIAKAKVIDTMVVSDTDRDILKMAVINRYAAKAGAAIGFIKNIGLKKGALASTVAHDCHNIIVVGCDDTSMAAAANALIAAKGGIVAAVNQEDLLCLDLPVAGLMSTENAAQVAAKYIAINTKAKTMGCSLHAPFMTLSFMALLVIPALKLSDKGLFNGTHFSFCDVEV